jgi:hypothetical protein
VAEVEPLVTVEPPPVAAAIVRKSRPKAVPNISKTDPRAAQPAAEPVVLTFVFDPPYEVDLEPGGVARSRHGVSFERGKAVQVRVRGNGREFGCTVTADPTRRTVRIDGDGEQCSTR